LIPEGVHKSERHMVARGEHGREIPSSQELAAREVAELRAPVTQDRGVRVEFRVVDLRQEPAHPGLGLDPVLRAREVDDLAVAQVDQMTATLGGASPVL